MTRLRRIETCDRVFFVTTNLAEGTPPLKAGERDLVLQALSEARSIYRFLLFGYVVMPDHAHALFGVLSNSLAEIMHRWKFRAARAMRKTRGQVGPVWQARYFDFICRRTSDVANKLEYIHQNPVVAGLVERTDDWTWSSASFYTKKRQPPLVPDIMDFSGDPDQLLWPASGCRQ